MKKNDNKYFYFTLNKKDINLLLEVVLDRINELNGKKKLSRYYRSCDEEVVLERLKNKLKLMSLKTAYGYDEVEIELHIFELSVFLSLGEIEAIKARHSGNLEKYKRIHSIFRKAIPYYLENKKEIEIFHKFTAKQRADMIKWV